MGDDNEHVILYDETSPLEQSRRNILQYHPVAQPEAATYLVELPEKRIDAPRPSTRPTRRSTIVNTLQLPDTREAEDQPLEEYVRRNLSSFRKSLTPEDLQRLQAQAQERYREGEVVRPATVEDIQRETMDNKKGKNKNKEREKRANIPNRREIYQSDSFSEPKTHNLKHSNKFEDAKLRNSEKKKQKYYHDLHYPRNEVVVMPALEPVSVSHKSPFDNDPKRPPPNSRPFSPVKVKVSVESSDEEDKKRGGKHDSKKGKSDPSSAKRITPTSGSGGSKDENERRRRKRRQKEKSEEARRARNESRDSSRSSDEEYRKRKQIGKAIRKRSSSVCLSGESGENSSEPHMVNNRQKRGKRASNNSSNMGSVTGEKSSNRDNKRSPPSSAKRGRESEDLVDYKQTTNPFGKQDPYAVHFAATSKKKKPDQSGDKNKKKKVDNSEKTSGDDPDKKAPRTATKVVAKRRYHIQIPEHGRPETWFNVRFNMNAKNNVDMNYDGPVKINNYYASNNYT